MYELTDTFNSVTISKHRTLKAAVLAQVKHSKRVTMANGSSSYIPKAITKDGEPLTDEEHYEAQGIEAHI